MQRRSIRLSLVVAVAGLYAIWRRGYLIPFTPEIIPRLMADDPSDHPPREGSLGGNHDPDYVLDQLIASDVINATDDNLRVTDDFEDAWQAEIHRLADASLRELVERTATIVPSNYSVSSVRSDHGNRYVVIADATGRVTGETWVRRPKVIAELAAISVLEGQGISAAVARSAASALCVFLATCPGCGGSVTERRAGGCCSPPRQTKDGQIVMALVCRDCGVHLHIFNPSFNA